MVFYYSTPIGAYRNSFAVHRIRVHKSYAMRAYTLCAFEWKITWLLLAARHRPHLPRSSNITVSLVARSMSPFRAVIWTEVDTKCPERHTQQADRPHLVTRAFFISIILRIRAHFECLARHAASHIALLFHLHESLIYLLHYGSTALNGCHYWVQTNMCIYCLWCPYYFHSTLFKSIDFLWRVMCEELRAMIAFGALSVQWICGPT